MARGSAAGSLVTYLLKISNVGQLTLSATWVLADVQFSVSVGSLTIEPGESQSVSITFAPASEGIQVTDLEVITNDADEANIVVPLAGMGLPALVPDLSLSDTTLVWEDVRVGDSATNILTVFNTGTAALSVASIA